MAHFLEHLVFKGGAEVRRLPQGQRDGRADGRGAQRLHVARPGRVPHHLPGRGGRRGDRPADRLRRAPEDRRRGARPRARRRDPGDRARQRPAVGRRRAPDRPRGVRRSSARAARAGPGGAPALVHARGDRGLPLAPVGRRRAAARSWSATSSTCPRTASSSSRSAASRRSHPTARPSRRRRSRRTTLVESRESNQSHLRISYRPSIDPRDPSQRAALGVYSTLLGGSMGSRLFDEIREQRGLAYSVYSVDHSFADVPILQLSAGPGVGQVRRGLHAHARDRRRAAHRRPDARTSSNAPARTRPAGACWRSRTPTRSPATRPPSRSCSARTSTRTRRSPRSTARRSPTSAEVARGISEAASVACVGPHEVGEFTALAASSGRSVCFPVGWWGDGSRCMACVLASLDRGRAGHRAERRRRSARRSRSRSSCWRSTTSTGTWSRRSPARSAGPATRPTACRPAAPSTSPRTSATCATATRNTLVVAAGDLVGGSPLLSSLFHDEPTIEVDEQARAVRDAVGNHEFDEGQAELRRMQRGGCHPEDGCRDGNGFSGAHVPLPGRQRRRSKKTGRRFFPPFAVRQASAASRSASSA